nr:MAG TPA: hypothetical protein [Caudoviricetes sp.]
MRPNIPKYTIKTATNGIFLRLFRKLAILQIC